MVIRLNRLQMDHVHLTWHSCGSNNGAAVFNSLNENLICKHRMQKKTILICLDVVIAQMKKNKNSTIVLHGHRQITPIIKFLNDSKTFAIQQFPRQFSQKKKKKNQN